LLLDAILDQTYPRHQMDVVIADGLSQDGTRDSIGAFQKAHPDLIVRIVDNPRRTIPSGLNLACAAAQGEMFIRLDAHSIPISEYVERCVADLGNGSGNVVGGVWFIRPGGAGPIADGIAEAASNPLGVGDAMYRTKAKAGSVDTVPFGAFRRSLYEKMRGFDERLLTNEDYEFNTRVRREGGVVWLDPNIRSTYIARSSLPALARQYWRYGYWKLKMLQRHPGSIRWRQALPPVFVTSLVALGLFSFVLPLARFLLLVEIAMYVLVLLLAGVVVATRRRKGSLAFGLPLAIATMHLAWGSGFLSSLIAVAPEDHG
jgi:glycosyltransferase involved in cell wall biosynthesis